MTRRDRERLTDVLDAIDAIRATWTVATCPTAWCSTPSGSG